MVPTWAMNEGPVILGFAGAHAGVQGGLGAGGQTGQGGWCRHQRLEGPSVGTLDALAFPRVVGVRAPAATGLVQTLAACSVAGTVFSWSKTQQQRHLELQQATISLKITNYF